MKRNEEKVNYTIRIDKNLKDRFVHICKEMDSDSSKEIRKFMKKYISENNQLIMN